MVVMLGTFMSLAIPILISFRYLSCLKKVFVSMKYITLLLQKTFKLHPQRREDYRRISRRFRWGWDSILILLELET